MKQLLATLALGLAAWAMPAAATTHKEAPEMAKGASAPLSGQQSKMATCNKEATGKKGDERKAFMKECLSAKTSGAQQDKMKTCNAEAAGKTGDARKAFMKECLGKKA